MTPAIHVRGLRKIYTVPVREPGLWAAVRGLVRRGSRDVAAVDGISFDVAAGEMVGFLGPNGAGKTTALKMLSGLLHPSGGELSVLGFLPSRREEAFLRQITLVMGQRSQLAWDIPALDSFELNAAIYDVSPADYRRMVDEMTELLDLEDLIRKPVRNLSLGERMKCEIAVAILHRPRVLFLDEPTIGLDVVVKARIRDFLAELNRERGVTVLLTTHDISDIERLCSRVMIIDRGHLIYDGSLSAIKERFGGERTLVVDLEEPAPPIDVPGARVERVDGPRQWLRFHRSETTAAELISAVAARVRLRDLTIEEPEIEEIVRRIYSGADPGRAR